MTSELVVWTLSAAQALHEMRTQFTTGGKEEWHGGRVREKVGSQRWEKERGGGEKYT